jgi:hypothetical protein
MIRFPQFQSVLYFSLIGMMPIKAAQIIRGPYVQSAAADRMTICWRTDVATTSELSHGLAADTLGAPTVVPGTRTDHAVTLTGLQPSTRYYYRVQGAPESGSAVNVGGVQYWFKTAPAPGTSSPIRFWTVGDSGYSNSEVLMSFNTYQSTTAAQGKSTDLFIMLGDNAYPDGTDGQYQSWVFNRYASLIRNTPVWSAFGNHDGYSVPYPWTYVTPFETSFQFPTAGECGGVASGSERYYSFDHGNVHFIVLDTNTLGNYDDIPGGTYGMVDWLKADLESCSSDWIIACMHYGPYTRGSYDSDVASQLAITRNHVVPLLEAYGVDWVLYGHSHVYERSRMIDGHYGISPTFNPAIMVKWPGNGSDLGGVSADGSFSTSPGTADGAYQKPSAMARTGTVYSVVGASSSPQGWLRTSTALVSPAPHPVHQVSLNLLGSMVVEIDGHRLNARYLDAWASVRDDFTILKGATYKLHPANPTTDNNIHGIAFPVTRSGSTAFPEQVPVAAEMISGSGTAPAQGLAEFAAGQESALVKFFPAPGSSSLRFEARLLPTTRPVQPGAAPRQAYRISGDAQTGQFAGTPAATWYASRFGTEPSGPAVWNTDDDGDGLSLLLEYALGGEPGRNDAGLLPQGKIEGGAFVFRYTRAHGRSDLTYQVLASADLASWPEPGPSVVSDGPVTALGEPRKVELPLNSDLKFVKIKITLAN